MTPVCLHIVDPRKVDDLGEVLDPEFARYRIEEEQSFLAAAEKIARELLRHEIRFDQVAGNWIAWSEPLSGSACQSEPGARPTYAIASTHFDAVKAVCLLLVDDGADLFFTEAELNRIMPCEWIPRFKEAQRSAIERCRVAWPVSTQKDPTPTPTKPTKPTTEKRSVRASNPAEERKQRLTTDLSATARRIEIPRLDHEMLKISRQQKAFAASTQAALKSLQFPRLDNEMLKILRQQKAFAASTQAALKSIQFPRLDHETLEIFRQQKAFAASTRSALKSLQFPRLDDEMLEILRQQKAFVASTQAALKSIQFPRLDHDILIAIRQQKALAASLQAARMSRSA